MSSIQTAPPEFNFDGLAARSPEAPFTAGARFMLTDGRGSDYGAITLTGKKTDWQFGSFAESSAFATIKPLFDEHIELVNNQMFSLVDEVEEKISALGLQLETLDGSRARYKIKDVQIGLGTINFRLTDNLPAS